MKIQIFQYLNYRSFLKDHYALKKKQLPSYSYRLFNSKANLRSPSYYKLVCEGKCDLTEQSIAKFIKGLNLNQKEGLFFRTLVYFNQAQSNKDKSLYYNQLCHFKEYNKIHNLTSDQYDLFYNWFNLAIYEMSKLKNFQDNAQWVINRLREPISSEEAETSIKLLKKLGLLVQDPKTLKYKAVTANLTTDPEVMSIAVFKHHTTMIGKSIDSLSKDHHSVRDVSSITVALNEKTFSEAKGKIQEFRRDLNVLLSKSKDNDRVYQMNFQIFPLTKIKGHKA